MIWGDCVPSLRQVLCDGKVVWRSQPMRKEAGTEPPARVTVSLARVQRLSLRIMCPGVADNSHAVWIDPMVGGAFAASHVCFGVCACVRVCVCVRGVGGGVSATLHSRFCSS